METSDLTIPLNLNLPENSSIRHHLFSTLQSMCFLAQMFVLSCSWGGALGVCNLAWQRFLVMIYFNLILLTTWLHTSKSWYTRICQKYEHQFSVHLIYLLLMLFLCRQGMDWSLSKEPTQPSMPKKEIKFEQSNHVAPFLSSVV